jgi:thioredoxin-related protein
MQTIIDEFEKERKDVLILEIDAEKSFSISQDSKFNVLTVPTLFLFRNGKIIKRIEGYIDLDSLRNIFNTII